MMMPIAIAKLRQKTRAQQILYAIYYCIYYYHLVRLIFEFTTNSSIYLLFFFPVSKTNALKGLE